MMNLFKRETKLDKLKKRYTSLMRKSYEIALRDKEKSDYIHIKLKKSLIKSSQLNTNTLINNLLLV